MSREGDERWGCFLRNKISRSKKNCGLAFLKKILGFLSHIFSTLRQPCIRMMYGNNNGVPYSIFLKSGLTAAEDFNTTRVALREIVVIQNILLFQSRFCISLK